MLSCKDLCDYPQLPIVCIAEDLFDLMNAPQGDCETLYQLHHYTGTEPKYKKGWCDVIFHCGNTQNRVSYETDLDDCFGEQQSTTAIFLRLRTEVGADPELDWNLVTGEQLLGAAAYELLLRFSEYAASEDGRRLCGELRHTGTTKVAPAKTESGIVIGFDIALQIQYNVTYTRGEPNG